MLNPLLCIPIDINKITNRQWLIEQNGCRKLIDCSFVNCIGIFNYQYYFQGFFLVCFKQILMFLLMFETVVFKQNQYIFVVLNTTTRI